MGLFSRFMMVLRSNLNALLGRVEDPTKILEQTLLDMENAYRRAKDQVAHSIADQKRLEKSLAEQQSEAKRWQDRAVLAVEKGDDALAKEALDGYGRGRPLNSCQPIGSVGPFRERLPLATAHDHWGKPVADCEWRGGVEREHAAAREHDQSTVAGQTDCLVREQRR